MKSNKTLKISILVLSFALMIGAIFAMSISANTQTKTPEIISQNIEYKDKFCLMYAVDATTVAEGPVTLYLYDTEPTEQTAPIRTYTVNAATPAAQTGNLNKDAYIFTTEGVSYTAMDKYFYVVAEDSAENKSTVKRYSVAEYFYQRLADTSATASQKKFYQDTIEFGAGIQTNVNEVTNENELITALRYVVVDGGTLDGNYTAGLYPTGTTIAPYAAGVGTWNVVTYDANGNQFEVSEDVSSFKIPTTEGISKILFTTGAVISYRAGTDNLESLTALPGYISNNTSWELVTDGDHGKVLSSTYTSSGSQILIRMNNTDVSAENAKAFELSFDMKLTPAEGKTSNSICLNMNNTNGSKWINRQYMYGILNGSTANLQIDSAKNSSTSTFEGVTSNDWVNVKYVMYKDDPLCYIYINGSKTPFINTGLNWADYTGDISQIGYAEFTIAGGHEGIEVRFDNIFCGYTMDTKPESGN